MPELSIIVPVYKVEPYLRRCLDSILAQTFRDFELILIDDGSPDNCGAICDEYAAKDSRIIVIHQKNQGVSAARNAGLDIAKGTYLGFVDSDDWIEPEMYETMIATAKEKQVDVVACGIKHFDTKGNFIFDELLTEFFIHGSSLHGCIYDMPNTIGGCIWNKIYRHDQVMGSRYKCGVTMAEDRLFLLTALNKCKNAYKIRNTFYAVTEREDSATHMVSVNVPYEMLRSSYRLLELGREISRELEEKATDKFLDDCVRYIPAIKKNGRKTKQRYMVKLYLVRKMMLKTIHDAYRKNLIAKNKLRGYIYELLCSAVR